MINIFKSMGWTITLIVGLGLMTLAAALGMREHQWIRKAAIGDGQVVELISQRGSKGRTTYRPRVNFMGEDGREHTFTRPSASNPPGYHVGEVVKVAYDRETYEGRIMNFGERYGVIVFLAAIGFAAVMTSATFILGKQIFVRAYLS
jgi:hypothetical protein